MKIAFVCFDAARFTFLSGLYAKFRNNGFDVRAFYEHQVPPGHTRCRWLHFEIDPLLEYNPDRLIIFNGWAQQSTMATAYIQRNFNTYFVERAWLPQAGNIFIDREGLGGRSSLAKRDLGVLPEGTDPLAVAAALEGLRTKFKPGDDPKFGDYILVPLQLEQDTQILIDSPWIKTMKSLVDYVCWKFGNMKIVVKTHPKGPKFDHPFAVSEPDMNTLAYHARAIVGINSTSLIEALVHRKPVLSFGRSVVSGSGVFMDAEEGFRSPRSLLKYEPPADRVDAVLYNLLQLQFPKEAPPNWVLDKVKESI